MKPNVSECYRYGFGKLSVAFGDSDDPMFSVTFGRWFNVTLRTDLKMGYTRFTHNQIKHRWGGDTINRLHLFCFTIIWSCP